ncbi:MAG TPA: G1 family glutamic endopeptidase [Pseudacidobacterium sp.]|nr:G1 family glutamic endopeptidase [Pseudacidobacterium sp.]
MNHRMLSIVSALVLAAPVISSAQQLKPNELPTNLPGATTIAAPPTGFDPLTASDQDLEYYGYPPRPNEAEAPKAFATWSKAMAASKKRIMPKLEMTNNFAGPPKMKAGAVPPGGSAATSYNWSGYVNTNGVTSYGNSSYYFIFADYVVPVARQAYGACTGSWDYVVTWVGIDGWGSGDVLQAGNEADAYCSGGSTSTYYSAWYEWYPYGWTRIPSLPIAPGDDLFVEVWSTSSTAGHAYLVNYNTDQYVTINFSAPSGTHLVGNSAEWVVERPGVGGGLATLSNYISDYFSDSYAYNFNYNAFDPGSASSFPVTMLDNNGYAISYPTLLGSNAIWMQDEGSAR